MKALLGSVRSLVLGETWLVPLGTAALIALGAALNQLAAGAWQSFGGIVLVAGAVLVLVLSTRPPPRWSRRSPAEPPDEPSALG